MKFKLIYIIVSILFSNCSNNDTDIIHVNSVEIQGNNISEGISTQLTAVVLPVNATNKTLKWEVSDASVATISATGLLTAKKNGTVWVSATALDQGTIKGSKQISISSFDEGGNTGTKIIVTNTSELFQAISEVKKGDTIIVNQGTYSFNSRININTSGEQDAIIRLWANPEQERPQFDFSSMSENSSNQGILLNANYWHIKGIDINKAGDNGLQVKGNSNLIEFCSFSECADSGLQLNTGASDNVILNCDSYYNADSSLENADGFACKLDAGTGNKFIGCRAWQNLDDGWDGYLRGTDNITTTYENCWSILNGYLKDGTASGGDGNGFKTGGSDNKDLKHNAVYTNCIAVGNGFDGFDHNSNRGEVIIYNSSAYQNGKNYSFSTTNPLQKLTVKNSSVLGEYGSLNASELDITNNSWQDGITVTTDDFESVDYNQLIGARNADGSLPEVTFFHLNSESDLIDKGVDVGLPFNGSAPDLGAFEY